MQQYPPRTSPVRQHLVPRAAICILLGTLALSGCTSTAAATQTQAPTATTRPTAAADACGVTSTASTGGLIISPQAQLGDLAYPAASLPDGVAQQPLVSWIGTDGTFKFNPDPHHPTNPLVEQDVGGGYVLNIVNSSTSSHTVRGVSVCMDSFTAATGQLNEWQPCNGAYTRSTDSLDPRMIGGCGGNTMQNEYMHAPFTANPTVGTIVTATRVTASSDSYSEDDGPLPVTLQPGASMTIEIGVGPTCPANSSGWQTSGCVFATAGTYVFAFGVAVDSLAPAFTAISAPTLLAPAKEWTGAACKTSTMQARIPAATNPPTYYICPES